MIDLQQLQLNITPPRETHYRAVTSYSDNQPGLVARLVADRPTPTPTDSTPFATKESNDVLERLADELLSDNPPDTDYIARTLRANGLTPQDLAEVIDARNRDKAESDYAAMVLDALRGDLPSRDHAAAVCQAAGKTVAEYLAEYAKLSR